MIEELTVEGAEPEAGDGRQVDPEVAAAYEKLRAWRNSQRDIIRSLSGVRHKVGKIYDPHASELLRFMLEKLDPVFVAELAMFAFRPSNREFANHYLLEFDADKRVWNGISKEARDARRKQRELDRQEAKERTARERAERKAAKAERKSMPKAKRGRKANYGAANICTWMEIFFIDNKRMPWVGELLKCVNTVMGYPISRRRFFKILSDARAAGLVVDVEEITNGRKVYIHPGPKWADDLPDGYQRPGTEQAADDDNPAI